jgi:hypothetical protein
MEGLAVAEKAGVAKFILGKRYSFHKSVQGEYTSMRWGSLGKSILEGGTKTRIGVRGNQGATYVVETPKDASLVLPSYTRPIMTYMSIPSLACHQEEVDAEIKH